MITRNITYIGCDLHNNPPTHSVCQRQRNAIRLFVDTINLSTERNSIYEFAGHAAPKTDAGTDTGNAIDNENRIRKELGKPLRKRSEKHVE